MNADIATKYIWGNIYAFGSLYNELEHKQLLSVRTHTVNAVIKSHSCQTAHTKQRPKTESTSTMWLFHRWGSSGTSAPGPGAYDQSTLSMQTEVEKRTTNTARHGAFGVGERFAQSKAPDSAAVSMTYSTLSQPAPDSAAVSLTLSALS